MNIIKKIVPLNLTEEDEEKFESTTNCEHCLCLFDETKEKVKTRDHYHYDNKEMTGRLRKVLCQGCNLNYKNTNFVPIFAHNLSGYDGHLLSKGLGYDEKSINVIPSTEEKYISFTKKVNNDISMRFVDSFKFMSSSLDKLVQSLPKENLKHVKNKNSKRKVKEILC